MKQPKKPTRNQKEIIASHFLNWKEWTIAEETDFSLYLVNKKDGKRKRIDNFIRKGR